jgi:hypothetical protein
LIARSILIQTIGVLFVANAAPAQTTRPAATGAGQQIYLKETDPNSPRKSKLKSDKPDGELLRIDLDNDGDPDVLECWWNGKRCRWIDENDDMRPTDVRGDMAGDCLQVDRDGDGYYDGPEDLNVKWCDDDGDGPPDVMVVTANPSATQPTIRSGLSHYMVFVDVDHDGVLAYVPWDSFEFRMSNWRVPPTTSPTHLIPPPNFSPDYHGNSVFLKQHLPPWALADARFNWENPFAFYDVDGDGCTEMTIRLLDTIDRPEGAAPDDAPGHSKYRGMVNEAYSGIDLDNDSQRGNEFDFDMSIRFASAADGSRGDRIDYTNYHDRHPKMKAPEWALQFFRYPNWRKIDEFCYVTHDKCFEEMWNPNLHWGECWMTFDEDDDDHRWERVELYYPTKDPYSTSRWKRGHEGGGLDGHVQSDTLGDRGEWDADNSGRGKLYVGRWDRKLHLFGAERGAWSVDYVAKYWGSSPVLGSSSPEKATKVEELVQYEDTDNNGYFDRITFDYDGDQKVDLVINLLDYKTPDNPHPDVADLHNPGEIKWQGLHELYGKISSESFQDALKLYRAAWKKGLTDTELDDLAIASSTAEQYDHGYWLKEKLFRRLDKMLEKDQPAQAELRKQYFLGNYDAVVKMIDKLDPK